MNQLFSRGVITTFLVAGLLLTGGLVQAQEADEDQSPMELLQQQVERLQERVKELQTQLRSQFEVNVRSDNPANVSTRAEVRAELKNRLTRALQRGDRGPEVEQLQRILATSNEIYPEGLVTGYYGPLTEAAVARLQAKLGLPSVGSVGSQTLDRINELLKEGAGNSGIIPPGLLTAPGIQRRLDDDEGENEEREEREEREGDEEANDDNVGPDIDSLPIPEALKQRLRAIFDRFGKGDDAEEREDKEDELSDVKEEIADAEEEIARAKEEIAEEKEEGDETEAAELRLEEAREKLDEAKAALADGNVRRAEKLAEEAEDMAGEARMKYLGKTPEEVEDDELEIEAEIEDGEAEVKVEFRDGTEEEFRFQASSRDDVVAEIVSETDLTEDEIEAVLEFEAEFESDDDDSSDEDSE